MKAGRHRCFDKEIALEQAMDVFWTNGFAGTSMSDLTTAMGINKPSLYSAFGNKEKLYKSTLERYVQKYGAIHAEQLFLEGKSFNERLRSYLTSIAQMATEPKLPGGCFVCLSTCEMDGASIPVDAMQTIFKINQVTNSSLTDFFKSEIAAGNVSSERSPNIMANYIMSLQFGLAVMARSGAKISELDEIITLSTEQF